MYPETAAGDAVWPIVAVNSAGVTGSRGQRIKRARQRMRKSQQEVASAVGISLRTMSRIETDQVRDPTTLPLVESYLGIASDEPAEEEEHGGEVQNGTAMAELGGLQATATGRGAPDEDSSGNPRIRDATVMQLLAELAARFARADARAQRADGPPERVRWYTEDAPSAAPTTRHDEAL